MASGEDDLRDTQNPDGTYDGFKVLQKLYKWTTGKDISRAELEAMWEAARQRAVDRRNPANDGLDE